MRPKCAGDCRRLGLALGLGRAAGLWHFAAAIVASAPELSEIAVRRSFNPFGPDRWPQQTHLTVIERETPRKVARGDTFTLAVAPTLRDTRKR